MKILVIGNRIPVPPRDGGALAVFQMLKLLSQSIKVTFVSLNTSRQFVNENEAKLAMPFLYKIISHQVDTRIKPLAALWNLVFSKTSYNLLRFKHSEFNQIILKELNSEKYDLIQIEGLFAAPCISEIKNHSNVPIVIRTHNIEHKIWEKLAASTKGLKAFYFKIMAERLKKEELDLMSRAEGFAHISPSDDLYFKSFFSNKLSCVIPYGISDENIAISTKKLPFSVCHIGSLEWIPNKEGVIWFVEKVWPLVITEVPDAVFYLAGKNMPASFNTYQSENIKVYGEVNDAKSFVSDKQILITPIFSGSGIRIKILEAIALNTVVVSTSTGIKGLDFEPEKEVLIADTAEQFANQLIRLLQNPELMKFLQKSGFDKMKSTYHINSIEKKLTSFYQDILSQR
jgi:polysaccharide biosynthesis protein PslH